MKFMSSSTKSWNVDQTYENSIERGKDYDDNDGISTISGGSKAPSYSKDPTALFETPQEKKMRKRSHMVAYATMFVMTVGFSVVLSGVWPYLQSMEPDRKKQSLGWVVAANPFGQMIASPVVGAIGNRLGSIRLVCYCTMTLFILGNVMYAFLPLMAGWWTNSSYHLMIISRFIVGLSSSNVTLCRSYLAGSTTVKERTTGIAIISAAQSLGFVVGPAIQTIFSLVISDESMKYRAPGWFAALLGVINFFLLTPWVFQEYNISEKERSMLNQSKGKEDAFVLPKTDYVALFTVLFGFFMNQFIYVLLETLMEPFLTDQYEWCNDIAVVVVGVAFAFAGVLAVAMFFTATRLAKFIDERKILLLGAFAPICVGVFLFIPWGPDKLNYCSSAIISTNESNVYINDVNPLYNLYKIDKFSEDLSRKMEGGTWCNQTLCYGCPVEQEWCEGYNKLPMAQFFVAYIIVVSGYPYGVSMSNALFSKIVGPRPQGFWMGILTASGSLSRVLGPIFVSYIYTNQGTTWTFGVLFVGMILAVIVISVMYKRIVPMKFEKVQDNNRN